VAAELPAALLAALARRHGFQSTLAAGSDSRDFFGFAQGKDDDRYLGFTYGKRTSPFFDSSLILIEAVTAAGFAEAQRAAEEAARPKPSDVRPRRRPLARVSRTRRSRPIRRAVGAAQATKKHFFGSIELDAIQAKKQFADLVDEVVLQFTSRPGVKVRIAIEIQAEAATGFDDGLQRAVKENCNVLRFKNAEFEESE
jgi:hypothetical protein